MFVLEDGGQGLACDRILRTCKKSCSFQVLNVSSSKRPYRFKFLVCCFKRSSSVEDIHLFIYI